MARHLRATTYFVISALISGCVAFCLQLVGVFGPAWAAYDGDNDVWIEEGVWFSRVCENISTRLECVISPREWVNEKYGKPTSQSVLDESHWAEFKVLTLCALAGCLFGNIVSVVVLERKRKKRNIWLLCIGVMSSAASSIMLTLPVFKLVYVTTDMPSSWTSAWARTVTCAGSFVELFTAALLVLAVSQSCLRALASKRSFPNTHRYRRHSRRLDDFSSRCSNSGNTNGSEQCVSTIFNSTCSTGVCSIDTACVRLPGYDEISTSSNRLSMSEGSTRGSSRASDMLAPMHMTTNSL